MKAWPLFAVFAVLSLSRGTFCCPSHGGIHGEVKTALIEAFKKKLLQELGMSSVPNNTKLHAPRVPKYFRQLVEARNKKFEQLAAEKDNHHAKTRQVFLFPKVISVARPPRNYYFFEIKRSNSLLEINSATLWLHISDRNISQSMSRRQTTDYELQFYTVHDYCLPGSKPGRHVAQKLALSLVLNSTGWNPINISTLAKTWFSRQPVANLSLNIQIIGKSTLQVGGPGRDGKHQKPFLVADVQEVNADRKKRAVELGECTTKAANACCRHSLVIDFHEIGFSFVIMPKTLALNICSGQCYSMALFSAAERATAFKKLKPSRQTCCVPRELRPINILYVEETSMKLRKIPDVIAHSCHCTI